ncbi:hypothetical protein [Rheinheimera metallidurans]|uniref:hypothetical protein n=1 Tax=Rheinheimera metallidurans TaxID=2925781 RepID=UPI0030025040
MNKFYSAQKHLLDVLKIAPLALNQRFSSSPAKTTSSKLSLPDLTLPLAQDIELLLADKLQWWVQADLTQALLVDNQLLTPPLAMLELPEQKKALWALLSAVDDI